MIGDLERGITNPIERDRKFRRRARAEGTTDPGSRIFRRREHFVVALDRARLRIYREARRFGQAYQNLELVEAIDFPEPGGAEIAHEERLPLAREQERRRANDLAAELDVFLANRPAATWDLAASPTICRAVLARLSSDTQHRLRRSVLKDVVSAA